MKEKTAKKQERLPYELFPREVQAIATIFQATKELIRAIEAKALEKLHNPVRRP